MSAKRQVIVDRVSLRLPPGAERNATAILRELGRALAASATEPRARLRVVARAMPGDTAGTLAGRIARRAAAQLTTRGGDGG